MQPLPSHTLDSSPLGASVRVMRIEGEDAIAQRLHDLGFWPGTEVSVLQRAPFGGPLAFSLQGYRLALRRTEAARVVVTTGAE